MIELSKSDKVELSRMLESIQGRFDRRLGKLIMDLVFRSKIKSGKEDYHLFSSNLEQIPDRSLESFSLGSFFGQTYQISLDLAKKMELKLDPNQKRVLREFVFFLILFKFEKEISKK